MSKKTNKYDNTSKEVFELNKNKRLENIDNLKRSIMERELFINSKQQEVDELQFQIDLGPDGFQVSDPVFAYETKNGWNALLLKKAERTHDAKLIVLEQAKDILSKEQAGLKEEQQRMQLIEQGIPAWNDHDFRTNLSKLQE